MPRTEFLSNDGWVVLEDTAVSFSSEFGSFRSLVAAKAACTEAAGCSGVVVHWDGRYVQKGGAGGSYLAISC